MPIENWNSSMNTEMWSSTGTESFGLLLLTIVLGLIIISSIGLYNSLPLYSKLRQLIKYLIQSFTYFLWGVVGFAVLGVVAWIIKYLSEPGEKIISFYDIGKGITIYALICGFGYLIVKFKNRIKEHENKLLTNTDVPTH